MCLLSLNDTEIKDSILSINNFKNNDDTIYLLEIDDFINYNDLEIMKIKNNIIYFSLFDTELINKLTNLDNKLSSVIEDIINSNNDIKVLFNDTFKYFPLLNNINDTFYIKVSNNNKTDLIKDMTIIYLKTTIQIYISSKYKCSYINQKISLININNDELSVIDYENLSNSDNSSYNSRNSDSTSDSTSDSYNSRNSDSTSDSYNSRNSDSSSDTYNSKNSDSSRENNVNINNKFYDDTDSSNKLSDNDYNNTISDHTDENNYDNTDSIHTDNKEENKFTISDNEDNENNKDNEDKQINENNKNKEKNNNNENNKNNENNNENEKKSIKFEKVNKKTDYKCNKCGKEYKFEKNIK